MRFGTLLVLFVFGNTFGTSFGWAQTVAPATDPYLWLEDAQSPAATQWADAQTKSTLQKLQSLADYKPTESAIGQMVNLPTRLPAIRSRGGQIYNFWQDATHPHGLYRRTTVAEFRRTHPKWEILFDLDALVKSEKINWVWGEPICLPPQFQRCLFSLSNGGTDARVIREYDLQTKSFVKGGFQLPAAKSEVSWIDLNNLFVGTDFGPGTVNATGYPRLLKRWHRGDPLSQATTVLTSTPADLQVAGQSVTVANHRYDWVQLEHDFYHSDNYLVDASGALVSLPFPTDAQISLEQNGYAFIQTMSPWTVAGQTYASGSLLAWKLAHLPNGRPELLFQSDNIRFLSSIQVSGDSVYLSVLNHVQAELYRLERGPLGWSSTRISLPAMGTITFGLSDDTEPDLSFEYQSFVSPRTIFKITAHSSQLVMLKSAPTSFNGSAFAVDQYESVSLDGTHIPYFVVHAKNWHPTAQNPTLVYAYGGFEDSQTPFYSSVIGKVWLERGGVFVLANIRGGDEFGPLWHSSVVKENRQKVYDDFISVAEDLIQRQVAAPDKLAIMGGSNGGLTVGAAFVERPDLFKAVVCEVPLLDMIRYPLIGAGSSWEAEYGDPSDPQMAAVILKYSPYQNLKSSGVNYPSVLFTTSRTDDRVGPAHARKMAAKMLASGQPALFYEDAEGGHTGGDNQAEEIRSMALT